MLMFVSTLSFIMIPMYKFTSDMEYLEPQTSYSVYIGGGVSYHHFFSDTSTLCIG